MHGRECRKQSISRIPTLTYLDDRPVFANEREIVEGWHEAGLEGERKAREVIAAREKEQNQRNFDFMQAIRAEAFREVCTSIWNCIILAGSSGSAIRVHCAAET